MLKNRYLFYCKYLKGKSLAGKEILIAKTKESYLIGPLINKKFDDNSFRKRLISNTIYPLSIYKKMSHSKCKQIISKYEKELSDNEVLEVFRNGDIVRHTIIRLPGENNE